MLPRLGLTAGLGAYGGVPVPVSATICGLPGSESVMVKTPVRRPVWVGVNRTFVAHLPWGGMEAHSLVALKSPVAVTLVTETGALP